MFESLFDIIHIFGGIEPYSESTSPFQYIIIFQTYQSLELPGSTPGGDRHMRPLTFCRKFHSQRLLFEAFLDIIGIFGNVDPYRDSTFPFQGIIIFQTYQSSEPPGSTHEGDRHMRPLTFL